MVTSPFTRKTLSFLRALKRNNSREWFHARRADYEAHVRAPMVTVVERLAEDFRRVAPEFSADPKTSIFRQWRDTRFSENKTPLKTHIAATFPNRTLGRMNGAGLYFEVAPSWVWIGGGIYAPDAQQLQAIRHHLCERHAEFERLVRAAAFKKLGGLKGERLTRVPRGFDRTHPAADRLLHKQFLGSREEVAEFATSPRFYAELLATFTALVPLCRFLNEPLVARAKRDPALFMASDSRQRANSS
jgi:uncharacterized protein (TIGR02453 family)